MRKARQTVLELAGREVVITNPDKPFFPQAGHTKLHLVRYYAAVAEGALHGIAGRPIVLKRYVDGAAGEPFFQKRAPEQRPEWIETVELRFPSGRTAREIVVRDAAQLLWMVNLREIGADRVGVRERHRRITERHGRATLDAGAPRRLQPGHARARRPAAEPLRERRLPRREAKAGRGGSRAAAGVGPGRAGR